MELPYALLPIGLLMTAYLLLFTGSGRQRWPWSVPVHGSPEVAHMAPSTPQAAPPTPRGASSLGPEDEVLLADLAQAVAAQRGSAVSQATVFRALLRLVHDFDGALLVRLVGYIEREGNAGGRKGEG